MLLCVIADATCRGWVRAAAAKRGRPIGPYDLMLAGVALSWGMVMVTSHATEFIRIEGSLVEDWRQA